MTLEELMKPNKYGSLPILDIVGVGHIMKEGNTYIGKIGYDVFTLKPSTEVTVFNKYGEEQVKFMENLGKIPLADYSINLTYLKVATAEERLFQSAVKPILVYTYIDHANTLRRTSIPNKILHNGTGWHTSRHGEPIPTTFYLEDILYRLDLQEEVK